MNADEFMFLLLIVEHNQDDDHYDDANELQPVCRAKFEQLSGLTDACGQSKLAAIGQANRINKNRDRDREAKEQCKNGSILSKERTWQVHICFMSSVSLFESIAAS